MSYPLPVVLVLSLNMYMLAERLIDDARLLGRATHWVSVWTTPVPAVRCAEPAFGEPIAPSHTAVPPSAPTVQLLRSASKSAFKIKLLARTTVGSSRPSVARSNRPVMASCFIGATPYSAIKR